LEMLPSFLKGVGCKARIKDDRGTSRASFAGGSKGGESCSRK
jgi:hypothetical protein